MEQGETNFYAGDVDGRVWTSGGGKVDFEVGCEGVVRMSSLGKVPALDRESA